MLFDNSIVYELPLSKNYVRHWGLQEAVREFMQNALDSDSPFEYTINDTSIAIHSRNAHLPIKSLLLGSTTKEDDPRKIGSFGEGYKIALLVLTREGYPVTIHNGENDWCAEFRHSKTFDSQVLCIVSTRAAAKKAGITVVIGGLSPTEIAQIRENCLYMQDHIGGFYNTHKGRILLDHPGKLYVGGLYVCKTSLKYGYDVQPEYLQLERDRQTVSSFDLQWISKEMWFQTEKYEQIAEDLDNKVPDFEYAHHGTPELVKEACYKRFKAMYPNKVIAGSQRELDDLVEAGLKDVVIVGGTYGDIVRNTNQYKTHDAIKQKQPIEYMEEFFKRNRSLMRKKAIVDFKVLLTHAKDWRLK